jgi:hypothetical protein
METMNEHARQQGTTMDDMEDLIREAAAIPFSELSGRRIFTLGERFYGLGTRKFRSMLRAAGAEIETSAKRSTDLIVVGENPSRNGIIRILLSLSEASRPPFVGQDAFLFRFIDELAPLHVERSTTFREHLIEFLNRSE